MIKIVYDRQTSKSQLETCWWNHITSSAAADFTPPTETSLLLCLLCRQTYTGHTCHIRRHDYPPGLHFNQSKALVPVCCCVNPIKEGLFLPVSLSSSYSPTCSTPPQSWRLDRAWDPTQCYCTQSSHNSTQRRGFPHWCGKLILSKSTVRRKKYEDIMGGFRGESHCTLKPQNGKLKPKEKNHL